MIKDSIRESLRNLLRRPLQSGLAILGIMCGVAGIIILSSVGMGVNESVSNQIEQIGPGLMTIMPTPVSDLGKKAIPLRIDDFHSLTADDIGSGMVTPIIQMNASVSGGTTDTVVPVVGVDSIFPDMKSMSIIQGRFFDRLEVQKHSDVAILGESLAKKLFPNDSAIGKSIVIKNDLYRVAGVCKLENTGQTNDVNNLVFLPYTTINSRLNDAGDLSAILIKVPDPLSVPDVETRIQSRLQRNHHWSIPTDAFTVYKQDQILKSATAMSSLVNIFVTGAILIAFLLGGIGVMNVMLMSTAERQHEIGVYLAFGARPIVIQVQFLLESVWISTIGVLCGVIIGTFVGLGLHANDIIPWAFQWSVYAESVIGGIVLGLIFGGYPSFRAALVQPAEVIRK